MNIRNLLLSKLVDENKNIVVWLMFKNGGSCGQYEGVANISMAETACYFSSEEDILCVPRRKLRNQHMNYSELFDNAGFKGKVLEIGKDEFSQMDKWLFFHIEEYRDELSRASAIITNQSTEYVEKISQKINIPVINISAKQQIYFNDKINLYNFMKKNSVNCPTFNVINNEKELYSYFKIVNNKHDILVKAADDHKRKIVQPIKCIRDLMALQSKLVYPCIVEPFYRVVKTYNFQFYVNKDMNVFLGSSIQLVKNQNGNLIHAGNILVDKKYEESKAWKICYELALSFTKKFMQCGYFGIVGLDIIETENEGCLIVDVNPRFNASTFMYSEIVSQIKKKYKVFFFINFYYEKDWYITIKKNLQKINSLAKDLKCYMVFSPVVVKNTIYLNLIVLTNSKHNIVFFDDFINKEFGTNLEIKKNII